jgi:hypothetical protein
MVTGVMSKVGGVGVEVKASFSMQWFAKGRGCDRHDGGISGGKVADIASAHKAEHYHWRIAPFGPWLRNIKA